MKKNPEGTVQICSYNKSLVMFVKFILHDIIENLQPRNHEP